MSTVDVATIIFALGGELSAKPANDATLEVPLYVSILSMAPVKSLPLERANDLNKPTSKPLRKLKFFIITYFLDM